jgi:hypothetical protein
MKGKSCKTSDPVKIRLSYLPPVSDADDPLFEKGEAPENDTDPWEILRWEGEGGVCLD